MSLWSEYIKEREGKEVIELEGGFAVYKITPEDKSVYLEHIYVQPGLRKSGLASRMTDQVAKRAKEKECRVMYGSNVPNAPGATKSMLAQLKYGFKLSHLEGKLIVLYKEL